MIDKIAALEAEVAALRTDIDSLTELLERIRCAEAPEEYLDQIDAVLGLGPIPDPLAHFIALAKSVQEIIWDKDDEEGLHYCSVGDVHRLLDALARPDVQRAVKKTP
jgi:hypothetical protein